jgi:hypothetical protein
MVLLEEGCGMIEDIILAVLALMAWSILYKQNPFYRIAESLIVGLTLAFVMYTGIDLLTKRVFIPWSQGDIVNPVTIAAILGFLTWTRFGGKSINWLSRWPLALLAGIGTGLAVKGAVGSQILRQLETPNLLSGDIVANVNNILIILGTITTLSYFTFSYRHQGVLGYSSRLGRIFMMLAFGTMLGGFVMTAMGYLIGNMFTLTQPPAAYIMLAGLGIIVIDFIRSGG